MKPRKPATLAATATLAIAAVVGISAPAHASMGNCPSGALCTWGDENFQTSGIDSARIYFQQYVRDYRTLTYPGTRRSGNDSASSIYSNAKSEPAYMYAHPNKAGFLFKIRPNEYNSNLWWVPNHNDTISSGYFQSFN